MNKEEIGAIFLNLKMLILNMKMSILKLTKLNLHMMLNLAMIRNILA